MQQDHGVMVGLSVARVPSFSSITFKDRKSMYLKILEYALKS
jgi:hypothetical protein